MHAKRNLSAVFINDFYFDPFIRNARKSAIPFQALVEGDIRMRNAFGGSIRLTKKDMVFPGMLY